jgi:hypothetical protein
MIFVRADVVETKKPDQPVPSRACAEARGEMAVWFRTGFRKWMPRVRVLRVRSERARSADHDFENVETQETEAGVTKPGRRAYGEGNRKSRAIGIRSGGRRFGAWFAVLVLLLIASGSALAGDRGKAETLAKRGISEQEAGRHEAALEFLDRSLAEFDHPMIRFFKARSLVALERWEGAGELYRTLLAPCKDLGPRNCEEVKRNASRCEEMLKETRVRITSGALKGAAVTLDGRALGVTPLETSLTRGRYELRVERAGFERAERTIEIAGQDDLPVVVPLRALPSVVVTPTGGGAGDTRNCADSPRCLWKWITLGGAVATLAGGAGLIGQHFNEVNKSAPEGYEKADVSPVGLYSGGALAAVGVGLGIASTVLFVQDGNEKKTASAWLVPTGDGFALGLCGTW